MSQEKSKAKTFHEGKNKNLCSLVVSLDNADTVIEGHPLVGDQKEEWS